MYVRPGVLIDSHSAVVRKWCLVCLEYGPREYGALKRNADVWYDDVLFETIHSWLADEGWLSLIFPAIELSNTRSWPGVSHLAVCNVQLDDISLMSLSTIVNFGVVCFGYFTTSLTNKMPQAGKLCSTVNKAWLSGFWSRGCLGFQYASCSACWE